MALETSTGELLRVSGLTASVDEKEILHGIDLSVAQGEAHVLMGPNGAGKSTLGHVVMGDPTYNVTAGSIVFNGQDVTTLSPDKRSHAGMFLSFQAPVEIPGVPLSSFLRAAAAGRGGLNLKGKQFRKHTQELCAELDFDPAYLDRELGVGFSGGEKKKLEMCGVCCCSSRSWPFSTKPTRASTSTPFPSFRAASMHTGAPVTARSSSSRTTRAFLSASMSTACMSW